MKRILSIAGGVIACGIAVVTLMYAWGSTGHRMINRIATRHLPSSMSSYKADSLFYETHSTDADARRNNNDTSFYAEWPRHFLDIDDYPNFPVMTHNLNTLIQQYGWERVKQNGINPWATQWAMDSLTAQLARGDRNKARLTMSDLGHYVADAHQPLHCTRNYDGQYTSNNGIHSRYESSMINIYQGSVSVHQDSVQYVNSPVDFAFQYIIHANSFVPAIMDADRYAKGLSGWTGFGSPPSSYYAALWDRTRVFTIDQIQRATADLASLWYTAWVNAGLSTNVSDALAAMPGQFELLQNYPNPFNPVTSFRFRLSASQTVDLTVYDVLGQIVATIVHEPLPPGDHTREWDASSVPSGVYYYRLRAGGFTGTKKLVLLR